MARDALSHLSRHQFLQCGLALAGVGLLSGCGLDLTPRPTQTAVRRIGILANAPDSGRWDPFRAGLRELGYDAGRDLTVEYRRAEGESDRYPALAAKLAALGLDCLVTEAVTASLPERRAVSA